jgi:hypothetical protein
MNSFTVASEGSDPEVCDFGPDKTLLVDFLPAVEFCWAMATHIKSNTIALVAVKRNMNSFLLLVG